MLYEQIEPFSDRRGDLQAAIVASTVANVNRSSTQSAYSATDFMPKWDEPTKKAQSSEEIFKTMMLIQEVQNTRVANG